MTGYGDARHQNDRLSVVVEIRAVNNRYLKISTKCPEAYAPLEHRIERIVRRSIVRGTVTITVRLTPIGAQERYKIDSEVLTHFCDELRKVSECAAVDPPPHLGSLLQLPGVVVERDAEPEDYESTWAAVSTVVEAALEKLQAFRAAEGHVMEQELRSNCESIAAQLENVARFAPGVVREYRDRLQERMRELLAGTEVAVHSNELIREVSIFAERSDINEEITRLRSHLSQFRSFLDEKISQGRRLEFLSQEMFREVNTIGSKGNNVAIAHCVVEMKADIEKMREILQNAE